MNEIEDKQQLKFYTTTEIAELLKMNVQVISRKLKYGEIKGYKIGKDWRVKETDLLEWLERHSNKYNSDPAQKVIDRFMTGGRFHSIPTQRKKRKYVLEYILKQFEHNRVYPEKEVNEIIMRYHEDFCFIRREFIMEKMMTRKDGKYRRNAGYIFSRETVN